MEVASSAVNKVPVSARLTLLERDVRGHSRSISTIANVVGDHTKFLNEVEEWRMKVLIDEARREEQSKALLLRLDQMTQSFVDGLKDVRSDVGAMQGVWTRIMWTIGSPVAVAVVIALLAMTFGKGIIPPIP